MYRVIPVWTLTGEKILPWVDTSGWSATSSLTSPGRGTFTLELRDKSREYSPDLTDSLCLGWGTTYVVEWLESAFHAEGTPLYAGMVVSDDWDADSGRLTVQTFEFAKFYDRRLMWEASDLAASRYRELTGLSLTHLQREVLQYGLGDLPLTLPWRAPGANIKRAYRYNFQTAQQLLDEIAAESDAPEHYARPVWSGGKLRWNIEFGTPEIDAGTVRVPVAAEHHEIDSPVVGLRERHDYQEQVTDVVTVGQGSEEDMRWGVGSASNVDSRIPRMVKVQMFKNVEDRNTLNSMSRSAALELSEGVRQWSYELQCSNEGLAPDQVVPGVTLLMLHPGDERIRPGTYHEYVIESRISAGTYRVGVESQGVRVEEAQSE